MIDEVIERLGFTREEIEAMPDEPEGCAGCEVCDIATELIEERALVGRLVDALAEWERWANDHVDGFDAPMPDHRALIVEADERPTGAER